MFNKNIIIGVVIVLIAVGGFMFSRQGGGKNLTRSSAAKMIEETFNTLPHKISGPRGHSEQIGDYDQGKGYFISTSGSKQELIKKFAAKGFVRIISDDKNSFAFEFTDQGKKYVDIENKGWIVEDELYNVKVTGITETSEFLGMKVREAEFTGYLRKTPLGEIMANKIKSPEIKSDMAFALYDDGWRIFEVF